MITQININSLKRGWTAKYNVQLTNIDKALMYILETTFFLSQRQRLLLQVVANQFDITFEEAEARLDLLEELIAEDEIFEELSLLTKRETETFGKPHKIL